MHCPLNGSHPPFLYTTIDDGLTIFLLCVSHRASLSYDSNLLTSSLFCAII